jgi:hypothetical protein
MCVYDRTDIGPVTVDAKVHPYLGRGAMAPGHWNALGGQLHQIVDADVDLRQASGSHQDVSAWQTHADVAILPRDQPPIVQPTAYGDDLFGERRA